MRHFYRMMTVIILTCIMLCGCSKENPPDKIADADFTVITGSDIPEELQSLLNERKKNPFSLTFTDQSYLYVVRGYGKQSCGGYKITVNDFCKREDGLYFDTELFGPKSDNPDERSSYPYIVIKTEYVDLPVSFSKQLTSSTDVVCYIRKRNEISGITCCSDMWHKLLSV